MGRKKWWFLVLVLGVMWGLLTGVPQLKCADPPGQWPLVGNLMDLGILGIPPGYYENESYGTGVNDSGQVVGYSGTDTYDRIHAFLWTAGQGMTDLGVPLGTIKSYPSGINNSRQISVNCFVAGWANLAYLNSASGWTLLDRRAEWSSSNVNAINRDGMMAGATFNTDPAVNHWQPCRWTSSGALEFIGDLGGTSGEAYGINGNGWVVGKSNTLNNAAVHAFLWKGLGQMIELETPTNHSSIALGVNDAGYSVGYVTDSQGRNYSVMWTPAGSMQYLGSLPGGLNEGQAKAINNRNEITGVAHGLWDTGLNKYDVWHAFLYRNGHMLDLGSTNKNPLNPSNGTAINDRGQVAGYGTAQLPATGTHALFCRDFKSPTTGVDLLLLLD